VPLFGEHPVEMGLRQRDGLPASVRADARYRELFAKAFPGEAEPVTVANTVKAIATFERTIISARSPYDRYHYYREDDAISASAKRGEVLYFSQHISCFRCHGGFNFDGGAEFHNTGLYNVPGRFSYPPPNTGIYEYTKLPEDVGKFKPPTLRNIALTAPYMHDGSIATLEAVLDHYAAGGRAITSGPLAGNGHDNPNKDHLIGGFPLTPQDRADFVEFLRSLTDTEVLRDPRFADPW
jgi:cytochrome c peroxidase